MNDCTSPSCLAKLRQGERGVLDRIDLSDEIAARLMEMGFVPGTELRVAHRAPGGDPRVYRVDGAEVALRQETACRLMLRASDSSPQE